MNELAPGTFAGLAKEEVELFRKVLEGVNGIGVEIGCLDGFSSRVILEAAQGLLLNSIDPFIPDSMELSLIGSREKYRHNVEPWKNRAFLHMDYSWEIKKNWHAYINLLFIDGDHTEAAVRRDFYEWTPWIVPGGLLAMHDARMGREGGANFHEGPSRVAREMIFGQPDKWEVIGEAFSLVIARKR